MDILWYHSHTGNTCYDSITILSYSFCNTIRIRFYMLCGMEGNMKNWLNLNENTPEYERYKNDDRVRFVWAVGGTNKKNSSSWMLDRWKK